MPYPLRSPRNKQHRPASPVPLQPMTSGRLKTNIRIDSIAFLEVRSSFAPSVPPTFNEYPSMPAAATVNSSLIDSSQLPRIQIISQSPHFSPSNMGSATMPIQIPTPSNTGLPTASLPPHLTNLYPLTQSHSLPAYFFPTANIAYITTATPTSNSSASPFDFNTSMVLIANPNQHPSQPVHILGPIDHRSLQFAHYTPTNIFSIPPPPSLSIPPAPSRTCNILETMSNFQNKRPDNEEDKRQQSSVQNQQQQQQYSSQSVDTHNKQSTEQLPFKKRRYTGQQIRMATVHDDDDEVSDESVKK